MEFAGNSADDSTCPVILIGNKLDLTSPNNKKIK